MNNEIKCTPELLVILSTLVSSFLMKDSFIEIIILNAIIYILLKREEKVKQNENIR
jgi:hypothetical protein